MYFTARVQNNSTIRDEAKFFASIFREFVAEKGSPFYGEMVMMMHRL